jgi:hypothetical protein
MSVSTMLRKEKEGTLYKYTKLGADSSYEKYLRVDKELRKIPRSTLLTVVTDPQRKKPSSYTQPTKARRLLKERGRLLEFSKTAEPPPPRGVPSKLWDKRLEYGPGERVPALLSQKIDRMIKKSYKLQGHTEVQGIPVSIENRKGSVRKGTDSDGHEWRTKMKHPYGYITGTKGADDEPVDAYVGPDKDAPNAFVVHQHKDTGKGYDEDKVMLGFKSKGEAQKGFLKHYDDKKFLGPTSTVPVERLKGMVESKKKLVKISSFGEELLKLGVAGGLATTEGKKPGDFDPKQLKAGTEVEKEHGNDPIWARQIAMDHLTEIPDYYTRLDAVEEAAKEEKKKSPKGKLLRFFRENPNPSDDEVHAFAKRQGINEHRLEEKVYKAFAELLGAKEKASFNTDSMLDELMKLSAISPLQFEAAKLRGKKKNPVTRREAKKSLKRLKKLEKTKATPGELGRAAGVGAVVGPAAAVAYRLAAGPKGRAGLPIYRGLRDIGATAAQGAVYGGLLPAGRHRLEREVEKQKLREYVGAHRRGTLRGKIRKATGL